MGVNCISLFFLLQEDQSTRKSDSSSSISTSLVEDTSPESVMGKKSKNHTQIYRTFVFAVQQIHVIDSMVLFQLKFCTPFCLFPVPPKFLPISSTPQPDKRFAPQRRHSIEKEAPTSERSFLPPSRQSSKSLVTATKPFFSSVFDMFLPAKLFSLLSGSQDSK